MSPTSGNSTTPIPRGLSPPSALNLIVIALTMTYALVGGWMATRGGLTDPVGGDFRAFLASARIARTFGYAEVYNLQAQEEAQRAISSLYTSKDVETLPTFFFPVFVIPFQLFLSLSFPVSLGIWTLINLFALALFAYRFTHGHHFLFLLGLLLASFPAFANFLWGQVNVWLLWCVACFLEAWEKGRPFYGGLWLGGLLLKPQTLVWVLPGLLLRREWRALAGFGTAGLVLLSISLGLAGPEGMRAWLSLPFRYMGDSPAIIPEAMMNLRGLGKVLSYVLPSSWAWRITGALGLAMLALSLWTTLATERKNPGAPSNLLLSWLAVTCATTWHSNGHMGLILLPPLLHQIRMGQEPPESLILWALIPSGVFILFGFLAVPLLVAAGWVRPRIPSIAYPALALLAFNVYFVVRSALKVLNSSGRRK